ncbi:hypothetical protein M9Y10_031865 [Tritrichomonas musculus]|uniref:EamA domain-containing protein n=1 Tax=Tritrichomonas musculus TaxID=1915356 RepID=A0ABR2H0N5_9EUKA
MVKPTLIFIPSQLISGAFYSITSKVTLQQESTGFNNVSHSFDKPFTQTLLMTIAMMFSLLVRRFWDSNGKGPHPPTPFRLRLILAIPALCDLITATLNIFGLFYINLSIYQMLRSSQIIFTAVFSVLFLKKKIKAYEIFGIALVVIALILVGWAGMFIPSNKDNMQDYEVSKSSVKEKLFGSLLVTFAQVFISVQIILEEYIIQVRLKDQVGALEVIGNEGLMGFFITLFFFPLAFLCPGNDPSPLKNGSLENTWDTLLMIYHKPKLILFFVCSIFFGAIYNICAMCVITYTSSLTEAIIDAVSTLFVWILMLISYQIGLPFGEPWNIYSFIELSGFLLLVTGNLIYNGQLKLPFCKYPIAEQIPLVDNSTQQSSISYVQTLA